MPYLHIQYMHIHAHVCTHAHTIVWELGGEGHPQSTLGTATRMQISTWGQLLRRVLDSPSRQAARPQRHTSCPLSDHPPTQCTWVG